MIIDDMRNRCDLESIASFILYGSETTKKQEGSFDERLRKYEREIEKEQESLSENLKDKLWCIYSNLIDLYFQEGIRFGHKIATDLNK